VENYELAMQLKRAVEQLSAAAGHIEKLEVKKRLAVQREDYDTANALKLEIDRLRIDVLRGIPEYPGKDSAELQAMMSMAKEARPLSFRERDSRFSIRRKKKLKKISCWFVFFDRNLAMIQHQRRTQIKSAEGEHGTSNTERKLCNCKSDPLE
jgi:hypothetical protein